MPAKIGNVSKDFILGVELPENTKSYTVISHKFVIDTVEQELKNYGFTIVDEIYRAIPDGNIATGLLTLSYKEDPELNLAFAWTNSYNKQVKFKACVGAISNVNNAFMILGEQGSWVRKHTGSADIETKEQILNQIKNAKDFYEQLLLDKQAMKKKVLNKRQQSELLGVCYADYSILETTTASLVKQQMIKPPFFYAGGSDTLWAFYNHLIYAIQDNHPKTWLEEQRMIHYIVVNEFDLNAKHTITEEVVNTILEQEEISHYTGVTSMSLLEDSDSVIEQVKEEVVVKDETPVTFIDEDFDTVVEVEEVVPVTNDFETIAIEETIEEVTETETFIQGSLSIEDSSIQEEDDEKEDEVFDFVIESESIVEEATEEEVSQELYGVNNSNVESELSLEEEDDEDDDYFSFL